MLRWVLAGGTAVLLLLIPFCTVPALLVSTVAGLAAQSTQVCTSTLAGDGSPVGAGSATSGLRLDTMSTTQTTHARTIISLGRQRGIPDHGIVIALATAAQESKFQNYANDGTGDLGPDQRGVAASLNFPHDAVGRDHGSVNVFQQQYPWWGSLEELMQPDVAAGKFYDALLQVSGWQQLPVTIAAQRVQRSAYPDAYAQWEPLARQLLASVPAASTPASGGEPGEALSGALCGSPTAMTCPATGLPAEEGLSPDALRVLRCVTQEFGITTFTSTGSAASTGRTSIEILLRPASPQQVGTGDEVAQWLQQNSAGLGVRTVTSRAESWTAAATTDPAQPASATGSPGRAALADTPGPADRVLVTVFGNAAGTGSAQGWVTPIADGAFRVTSLFGYRVHPITGQTRLHSGADFAAPQGTPLMSITGGEVLHAGPAGGYGNLVIIRTTRPGETIDLYYAHLCPGCIQVRPEDTVAPGQRIGAVGTTGASTGPHLHLETRVDGKAVDPLPVLAAHGLNLPTKR